MALFFYLFVVMMVLYLKYRLDRSRMYELADAIPGPPHYPIIGAGYKFLGDDAHIAKQIQRIQLEGDIVKAWIGPVLLVMVSTPEYADIIMNHPNCLGKSEVYKFADPFTGLGIGSAPVTVWKRHRKLLAPAFQTKVLERYVDVIVRESCVLVDILEKDPKNIDVCHPFVNFSVNVFVVGFLGVKNYNAQHDSIDYDHLLDNMTKISFMRVCKVWLHNDFFYQFSDLYKEQEVAVKQIKSIVKDVISMKKKGMEGGDNDGLVRSFPDGYMKNFDNLSEIQVFDEMNTFFIAGSDTTSNTLSFALTLLSLNPHIQDKVLQEALDVLGPDRMPTCEDLTHLKYAECVIKETLRILPTIPNIGRVATADIDLGEYVLPAGSQIVLGIWTIHRSPKYWKDPLKFDPDRFLPENSAERYPGAWIPFAAGPRNCIGLKFAMIVMKVGLAMLIRKFRITSEYKSLEDIEVTTNVVLKFKDKLRLSFETRQDIK